MFMVMGIFMNLPFITLKGIKTQVYRVYDMTFIGKIYECWSKVEILYTHYTVLKKIAEKHHVRVIDPIP